MKIGVIISVIFLLILGALLASSYTQAPKDEDIYGVWEGKHGEAELFFTFNTDRTCSLVFVNSATGETDEINGNFDVNFSKHPAYLSIRNIPRVDYALHTIIKFTDKDSIIIAEFSPKWRLRPVWFGDDSYVNLTREEKF